MATPLRSLEENGYVFVEDQEIGRLVPEMEKQGLSGEERIARAKPRLLEIVVSHRHRRVYSGISS